MNFPDFSLSDWLIYLENMHVVEIKLGLERIVKVAQSLNLLQCNAKVIIVAGTNGKGSSVAALEAIYTGAGYNVASYTSPHLLKFNERICINRQAIGDEDLCGAFMAIENARNGIILSYFEITTLAALWYFKKFELDLIILEVGLGGRLDATNIIDADLAIITTIDFDHQAYLGSTLEAIGYEKAGILRANQPCIYADKNPPRSIVEYANALHAKLYCLGRDYDFNLSVNCMQLNYLNNSTIELAVPKIHPQAMAAAVIASMVLQDSLPITSLQLTEASSSAHIYGRQQLVGNQFKTIFDVAHNPQAVALLADLIDKYRVENKTLSPKVHAVFSALQDKDLRGLIKPMQACVDFWYPACLSAKRAASIALLQAAFLAENEVIECYFSSPAEAYESALQKVQPGDLIVVYGSFLMVAAVMHVYSAQKKESKFI